MPSSRSGPSEARHSPAWLTAQPFAHRGLHGGFVVENSRAAFEAAVAQGFGIELDVQPSRCGTPMVFHDSDLSRLCGEPGRIGERDRASLSHLRLSGTSEPIPGLDEILALVRGRVPLLIEIKSAARAPRALCRAIAEQLSHYPGPAAIMSFHPAVPRRFAFHAPDVVRGLVVTEENKDFKDLILLRLALRRAKADFLAYDIRSLPSGIAAAARARGHPILSWTVRNAGERERAAAHADQIIFERA